MEVITLGCRLNFYESELIKEELKDLKSKDEFIIINSCTVTNEAERKLRQLIRKAHKQNPGKKIVVAGCAAQLKPKEYSKLDGVYKVVGNIEKLKKESYSSEEKILVGNIDEVKKQPANTLVSFAQKSRYFIQIQNGCNHDCTFCAITKARGNNRSVPIESIIKEISAAVNNGYKEVVLTGVDITDYGEDLLGKPSFSFLIKRILNDVKNLARLRLSSIDAAEVDDLFFSLIKNEERLMPHLHLSLQSGDQMILKRMKRRHTPKQIYNFHKLACNARGNIGFGADIIAGFPTETEDMFKNTFNLVKELKIPYLHIFPYSAKAGTKAALMPQVPVHVRKRRAKELIELGKKNMQAFYEVQINKIHKIVVEQGNIGHSENFCLVKLDDGIDVNKKEIIKSEIYNTENQILLGRNFYNKE